MLTPIQKIRELRSLLDEGLLQEAEFEQRKNVILDAVFSLTAASPSEPANALSEPSSAGGTDLGYLAGQEVLGVSKAYRLEQLLGQGGMGQVWKVIDLTTQIELGHSESLALKILAPELSGSAVYRRLLIEEAALVRKLAHENIVRVYDWARDPATGNYFIIMEFLDGQDLESYLRTHQRCSLQQVMRILLPVAKALQYAWDKYQLVHRDLKPSNLFLCKDGAVKLLDFGISARLRGQTQAGLTEPEARLAQAMNSPHAGTVGYRAPEAGAHQQRYHPNLDVYAVAVMLYQLLEGALPFTGQRHPQQRPGAPSCLNPAQWQVLQSGFAMDAAQRPASVMALLYDLQAAAKPDYLVAKNLSAASPSARNKAPLSEAEQRAEQRRQRKLIEQERRQQASITLQNLIAKQKQLQAKDTMAHPNELRFNVQPVATSPGTGKSANWGDAQRYLAKLSGGDTKGQIN